jgi:MFS family permease
VAIIAIYGTLKDLLDAVYPYPGGWLADHLGRRRALVVYSLLASVGYGLYLVSPSWPWILLGTIFVAAWTSLTVPAIFAIIGDSLPPSRRTIGFSMHSLLKRVPIVLAPPLGGWLIASLGLGLGIKLGLGITIILALVAIVVVLRYYQGGRPPEREKASFVDMWRSMSGQLKRLLVADCLARFADGITAVFVVLYVTDVLHLSAFQFGWLTSVQMISAMVLYIPVAKAAERLNRKPFVLMTFALFALFPLALVTAANIYWAIVAFAIAGMREIGEPARKSLIVDLVKETARGRAVGMYYLIRGLAVFPASLVGGVLWQLGPPWPFYAAFLVGVAGFLSFAFWRPVTDSGAPHSAKKALQEVEAADLGVEPRAG